ncbi:MAG: xanthine dehydrogenase family protein molybdopterin-binding subunit [Alphaproteobacteria bacterium]|nr:xanthine dehydrogenase family protein molybdopterin-binding subunit [Alphaproteobacteria bacterium]
MGQFGFGQPVLRKEDPRLLTGRGTFIDDRVLPHMAHAVFVRSTHAHARVLGIDTAAAMAAPGVIGVFTGADLAADGIPGVPLLYRPPPPPGMRPEDLKIITPNHPPLVTDRVRKVGDGIAVVVAETREAARAAADQIVVDYQALPSVTATASARDRGAPQLWPEAHLNLCFDWWQGDAAATDAAFARAAHVTTLTVVNNRVIMAAIETRGAIADYDPASLRLTLYATTQMPHNLKSQLANIIFRLPESRFRVLVGDVGGGFGGKNSLQTEHVVIAWASMRLGRPVKWIAERGEAFMTDYQARDNVTRGALALDPDGRFLAVRAETVANLGAYLANKGTIAPTLFVSSLAGVYTTPHIHVTVQGVFTNTASTDPYRGAGRPEATFLLERLIDTAARELALDPAELRRRNLIPASAIPYRTPLGLVYTSGNFAFNQAEAERLSEWASFAQRRKVAAARGRLRGLGMVHYTENTAGLWAEMAELRIEPTGAATVFIGAMSNGQGMETAYAQIVADRFGLHIDEVRVHEATDTDLVGIGRGSGGSSAIAVGGVALHRAGEAVIAKAKHLAAHLLEAAAADIEFADAEFRVAGTDRRLAFKAVAKAAYDFATLPDGITPGLSETGYSRQPNATFPTGCHVCEVEVDPETGRVEILSYLMAHDVGRILNPLLVEGQFHGGITQGLGQAGFEHTVYDPESGQLLSASFMDYQIPRADDLPSFTFVNHPTTDPGNPLGVKGCGESGATGAPAALVNAVMDALAPLGIRHIDMPLTPFRVWQAIQATRV